MLFLSFLTLNSYIYGLIFQILPHFEAYFDGSGPFSEYFKKLQKPYGGSESFDLPEIHIS